MNNYLFDSLLDPQRIETGKVFLETLDEGEISYGTLIERTGQIANFLTANGLRPGDRVTVQIPKCADAILIYLAVVRAGAIFLPLNPAYTSREVEYFLNDATPKIFICDADNLDILAPLAKAAGTTCFGLDPLADDCIWDDAVRASSVEFETVARDGDDVAALLYTSGTTGRSKGAMLSHDNLLSNARALMALWRVTSGDHLLHALPVYHTHGLFVATNVMLLAGASILYLPKFVEKAVIDLMPHATMMMGVPTYYTRLLQNDDFDNEVCEDMRLFISGSAPLLEETFHEFKSRTGESIVERYGMTETGMNTSNPVIGSRLAGTVGQSLPGVDVRIVDAETEKKLPAGKTGSIQVKGPNVFKGYWNQPQKTAEEFSHDGYFITGDLGFIDKNGYVTIVGRSKDLIISGGMNIYPKEVEAEINLIDGVIESAVIGAPHPDLGEAVVTVVASEILDNPALIMDHLRDRLAAYKQPKHIAFVGALPRNAMGKVQKAVLRKQYEALFG